jgi:paired amphipathic helix protein Sin3a
MLNDIPANSHSRSKNYVEPSSPRRSHQPIHSHRPPSRHRTTSSSANSDNHFFDNVKRALDNRDVYNEFLKFVNLFTQDLIDTATLVKESRNFLGDTELLKQFKDILGWDEKREREARMREQQHRALTRPSSGRVLDRRSRADTSIQYGSYRKLPASVSFWTLLLTLVV